MLGTRVRGGMAVVDPKRKYSWWWDSHISPKNSKWLQENLTGNVLTAVLCDVYEL